MSRFAAAIAVLLLLAALAAGVWWYFLRAPLPVPALEPVPSELPPEPATGEGESPRYPVPEPAPEHAPSQAEEVESSVEPGPPEPLPPLDESDSFMRSALARIFSAGVLDIWLKDERIVERLVVTINSLDGPAIPLRFWPVRHIEGLPEVERAGDTLRWSEANFERYRQPVAILQGAEPRTVARVYFRNYPLFQEAYDSLGLEDAYFNDRLVEIVDHLLDAPELEPGFAVKQPKVLYEYADPALESQSWGRKVLMRMGPDNAAAVKAWLRELRAELVAGEPRARE